MPFKKGKSGNPDGRPPGTKNKSTEDLRNLFKDFLEKNLQTLQDDFDKLEPVQRLNFIDRVAKIVVPPPFSPASLTEDQIEQVLNYLKLKRNEQNTEN